MARTNKETSRLAWAGVERGLKIFVTPVGTSAANVGATKRVVAIRDVTTPSDQRAVKSRNPNVEIRNKWGSKAGCRGEGRFSRRSSLETAYLTLETRKLSLFTRSSCPYSRDSPLPSLF